MTQSQLSIIIVNWNGIRFLPDCLRSIVENPPNLPFDVIVVDNASMDGSTEWLRSDECKQLMRATTFSVLEPGTNLGYGPGNNLAIDQTTTPNILILNSDTRVLSGAIDKLAETLRSSPKIGMVGPRLYYDDGSLQDSVSRHPASPFSILVEGLGIDQFLPKRLLAKWLFGVHWDHEERRAVPVVAGAAMMCKREMIDDVGPFDRTIHMYGEDLEWCVRARRGGWSIVFEPLAHVIHSRRKSVEQRWTENDRMIVMERAMLFYENKSFSRFLNLSNGITKIFVLSLHAVRWKIQGRNPSIFLRMIKLHANNCKRLLLGDDKGFSKNNSRISQ
jgi:GT2 family glycosyltransferase